MTGHSGTCGPARSPQRLSQATFQLWSQRLAMTLVVPPRPRPGAHRAESPSSSEGRYAGAGEDGGAAEREVTLPYSGARWLTVVVRRSWVVGRGGVVFPLATALSVVHRVHDLGLRGYRDQRGHAARRSGGHVRDRTLRWSTAMPSGALIACSSTATRIGRRTRLTRTPTGARPRLRSMGESRHPLGTAENRHPRGATNPETAVGVTSSASSVPVIRR